MTGGSDGLTTIGNFEVTKVTDSGWVIDYSTAIWTSPDGQAWHRVPDSPALASAYLNDVIPIEGGDSLAVGFSESRAVVVRSRDGQYGQIGGKLWSEAKALAVAVVRDEYVVVGGALDTKGRFTRAVVWRSTDGFEWTRTSGPPAASAFRTMSGSSRGLVAASSDGQPIEPETMTVTFWTSWDGATWTPGMTLEGATVSSILDDGAGLIAVGARADGRAWIPAAWSSGDGNVWEPMVGPTGEGLLYDVTAVPTGLVAVGSDLQALATGIVWISLDGLTWSAVDDTAFADATLGGVAESPLGLTVVGYAGPFDAREPIIFNSTTK